jgi:hypothetical protein
MKLWQAVGGGCSILAGLLLPSGAGGAAPPAERTCTVEVVQPDEGPRRAELLSWLAPSPSWKVPSHEEIVRVFVADVDNDGAEELMVVRSAGNAGLMDVRIFRPAGAGFTAEPAPRGLLVGATEFLDPVSEQLELLVRFCGKTYFTLRRRNPAGTFFSPARDTWIWQRGEARPVCNARWIGEQRRVFKALYDRQSYDDAYWFLDGLERACGPAVGPALRGWMESDLAVTALHLRAFGACLDHVAAARRSVGAGGGGGGLRRALATNAATCKARAVQLAATAWYPVYDLSWLLDLERHPQRAAELEPRFDALLQAIVPEVRIRNQDGEDWGSLRANLKRFIWPVKGEVRFPDGRFVVLSASPPHGSGLGTIWIDLETQHSVVAYGRTLGSTTIDSASIPPEAWEQTNNFGLGNWDTALQFEEPNGRSHEIRAPKRSSPALDGAKAEHP